MTSFCKLFLVAFLTEDALLFEDKHCVLELFLTAGTDKVFGMPATAHGCGVWASERGREGAKEEGVRGRGGERKGEREGKTVKRECV